MKIPIGSGVIRRHAGNSHFSQFYKCT